MALMLNSIKLKVIIVLILQRFCYMNQKQHAKLELKSSQFRIFLQGGEGLELRESKFRPTEMKWPGQYDLSLFSFLIRAARGCDSVKAIANP